MPKSTAKPKPPPDGLLIIWDADEPFPVRREEVDLVLSTLRALERVLSAEQSKEAGQRAELVRIETELAAARAKLDRLLSMVSAGTVDATDPDLKAHMDAARQDRDIAFAAKERVEKRRQLATSFSPEKVAAFGQFLRAVFQMGGVPFRKQYARMFIERIDVTAEKAAVRVRKAALRRHVEATEGGVVPISIQEWRTRHDSNV